MKKKEEDIQASRDRQAIKKLIGLEPTETIIPIKTKYQSSDGEVFQRSFYPSPGLLRTKFTEDDEIQGYIALRWGNKDFSFEEAVVIKWEGLPHPNISTRIDCLDMMCSWIDLFAALKDLPYPAMPKDVSKVLKQHGFKQMPSEDEDEFIIAMYW